MKKNYNESKNKLLLTFTLLAIVLSTVNNNVYAQSTKINTYLRMIAEGKVKKVKRKLPELIRDYGEEPGVLLLQGARTFLLA